MPQPAIEPVRRSFAILEALSRRPHGTILELTAETGLPRPTVVCLLQTLIELGYVLRISRQLGYRLTDCVLSTAPESRCPSSGSPCSGAASPDGRTRPGLARLQPGRGAAGTLRDLGVRQDAALAAGLGRFRRDGHAFTVLPASAKLQGIAVPIRKRGRVLGCITMRFTRSTMSEAAVGARFGPLLRSLAAAIAADARA